MYLKILSRDDDKTNTFMGIKEIEFFHAEYDSWRALCDQSNYADGSYLAPGYPDNPLDGEKFRVGEFNIRFVDGSTSYIIFDGVAFLCNEAGKTVDRYLAN